MSNVFGLPFSNVYDSELHIVHEILRDQMFSYKIEVKARRL